MMGSGGLVVMDEETCMVDVAKFFLNFTQSESCGKCTPCREGTKRMLEMLEKITDGKGEDGDIEKLEKLASSIKAGALCASARRPRTPSSPRCATSETNMRRTSRRRDARPAPATIC